MRSFFRKLATRLNDMLYGAYKDEYEYQLELPFPPYKVAGLKPPNPRATCAATGQCSRRCGLSA